MKLRKAAVLTGSLLTGALLAIPAFAAGDTITVGLVSDAKSLDPQATNDTTSSSTMVQMYEPLLEIVDKQLVPVLAEKWEQLDEKTYKFYLRKGIKFHNGADFTAEDAVFSLHRMTLPTSAPVKQYGDVIDPEGFSVIDDYTFIVKTRDMMPGFLGNLSHTSAFMMDKGTVEAAGENYSKHPIGTGPFKFVSTVKADRTVMERFEDYWGEKPAYKTLIYRAIPEANSRVIELETGNVDMIYTVPNNDVERLKGNDKVKVVVMPGLSITFMGFNTQKAPFDDPRVRKAIDLAIDKEGAIDMVYQGLATIPVGPMLQQHRYYPEKTEAFEYDPDKALELMKEAGHAKGFKMTIWTNDNKSRIDSATVIQAMLAEINIDVEIKVLEWGAFLERLKSGELQTFIIGWAASNTNPDPSSFVYGPFHSKFAGPSNRVWLKDAEVDELLDKGNITADGPERAATYHRLWDRINELTPWVYLANPDVIYAIQKDLKGADALSRGMINRLDKLHY